MALELEWKTYKTNLQRLSEKSGKFVLIIGEQIIDSYDSYDDALEAAYGKYGLAPFFVKQIIYPEKAQYLSGLAVS